MPINWIKYKGKTILEMSYKGETKEGMLKMLEDSAEILRNSNEKFLTLDDFEGSFGSEEFIKRAKELGRDVYAFKREKGAMIGVTGVKKILFKAFILFSSDDKITLFDTREEALEFLVKD